MIEMEIKFEVLLIVMMFCLWVVSKCSLFVEYNIIVDKYQFCGFGLVSYSIVELIFMENKIRLVFYNVENVFFFELR